LDVFVQFRAILDLNGYRLWLPIEALAEFDRIAAPPRLAIPKQRRGQHKLPYLELIRIGHRVCRPSRASDQALWLTSIELVNHKRDRSACRPAGRYRPGPGRYVSLLAADRLCQARRYWQRIRCRSASDSGCSGKRPS
jgi:hypothetical protein